LLALLLSAGCGGKSVVLGEVAGTLSRQGSPLENVVVEFIPDDASGTTGPRSAGVTDAAGHFVLRCLDGRPGAVVGSHRVVLSLAGRPTPGGAPRGPLKGVQATASSTANPAEGFDPAILDLYRTLIRTPLRQQVQPGSQNIDIPLP
jgi:hypothetical protein